MLKNLVRVVAVLLILSGLVWLFQGIGILPGSFMSGDPQWAVNGVITAAVGLVLFWIASRKSS